MSEEYTEADKQVKSKKRVADHGEVFTNEREVNAMLDLVKKEPSIIDILYVVKEFGWTSNFDNLYNKSKEGDIAFHYIKKWKRNVDWISRNKVTKSEHLIDTWKVLVPQAGSDGGKKIPDYVLGKSLFGSSLSVCIQRFFFLYVVKK